MNHRVPNRREFLETIGALGAGAFSSMQDAMRSLRQIAVVEPRQEDIGITEEAYRLWEARLTAALR